MNREKVAQNAWIKLPTEVQPTGMAYSLRDMDFMVILYYQYNGNVTYAKKSEGLEKVKRLTLMRLEEKEESFFAFLSVATEIHPWFRLRLIGSLAANSVKDRLHRRRLGSDASLEFKIRRRLHGV